MSDRKANRRSCGTSGRSADRNLDRNADRRAYRNDTVLIVDDVIENHDIIKAFLDGTGVEADSAFDGREALSVCASAGPDHYSLILMDINLPRPDGIEAAAILRRMGVTSPIIAMTALRKNEEKIRRAEDEGVFDALLFKPFGAQTLRDAALPYIKISAPCSPVDTPMGHSAPERKSPSVHVRAPEVCDIHTAIENMGNDPLLFMKHLNRFRERNANLHSRLSEMIDSGRFSDAAGLCHSVKGLSGMLSLTSLYGHIVDLEELLNGNDPAETRTRPKKSSISAIPDILHSINNDMKLICEMRV